MIPFRYVLAVALVGTLTQAQAESNPWVVPSASAPQSPSGAASSLPPPIPAAPNGPASASPMPSTPAGRMAQPGGVPVTNLKPTTAPGLPQGAVPIAPSGPPSSIMNGILNQASKVLDPNTEIEELQSVFVGKINGKRVYVTEAGSVFQKPDKAKKYETVLVKPQPPAQAASGASAQNPQGTLFPSQKPPANLPNSVGGVPINR